MLDAYKKLIVNQYEAAICTLNACIDRCPDSAWNGPVANHKFCQTVFHTLFYLDFYLGRDEASFRKQPFHQANKEFFADYEELEDRPPKHLYEKEPIRVYMQHCRRKVSEVIAGETADTLAGPTGFDWLTFTRAELHVYNIRHVQHHAAQLILRLRLDFQADMPWIKSTWWQG